MRLYSGYAFILWHLREVMIGLTEDKLKKLNELCRKHAVVQLSVFGSAARNELRTSSDIDFLVRFSEDMNVLDYADNYFSLLENLEELVGRKVDLVSAKSIRNPVLKDEINRTKIDLYAA